MATGGIPQRSPEREPDELLDRDDEDESTQESEADRLRRTREEDDDRAHRLSQKATATDDDGDDDDASIEKKARTMGWKPESEWRGRAGGWVDARTYMERSYRNRGIHKQQTDGLVDQIEELKTENEKLAAIVQESAKRQEESGAVLGEIWKRIQTSEQAGYEKAVRDLNARRRQAIEDGDVSQVDKLDEQIAKMKPPTDPTAKREEPAADPKRTEGKPAKPEVAAFIERNKWFSTDAELNTITQAMHVARLKSHPNEALADNLEWVEGEVKRRFPEKFENESRRGGGPPVPSERRGRDYDGNRGGGKRYTFNDLPADAKAACERFERTIKGFSREQYVADYFAD